MAAKSKSVESVEIFIPKITTDTLNIRILGKTPLILNRLSEKAKRELLLGGKKKNQAEKASTLKHDPPAEFQAAAHRMGDRRAPTLLAMPSPAFKGAMATAALDIEGAKKTQIERLTWVENEKVSIYGIPKMLMSGVRSADMARTPDIRTRVIVPEWACQIAVTYKTPMIKQLSIINLLAAAGMFCGVGDWRQEKGAGNYGQFEPTGDQNADWLRIVKEGGRAAQEKAMKKPEAYDEETEELFAWFNAEARRRGFTLVEAAS